MTAERRLIAVWAALLALTVGSLFVGIERGARFTSAAAAVILVIAMIKVRLIGVHFMDLRAAPLALRALFEGYVLIVCVALVTLAFVVR